MLAKTASGLLAMVNNLLDLARLEQGSRQLDLQPIQPESLLRSAADSIRHGRPTRTSRSSSICGECMPEVQVDVCAIRKRTAESAQQRADVYRPWRPDHFGGPVRRR